MKTKSRIAHPSPQVESSVRHLPFVNGAGFLFRLRENPSCRETPVAMITGLVELDDETTNDLRELHAELWFKPIWLDDVLSITRRLVAQGQRVH